MSFTNAQLAQKISDLIAYWSSFNEEYSNWLGGTVSGGPGSDGSYPLTDYTGQESLIASPAKLADDVEGYVGLSAASETAAAASAAAASTSESNASTSAATATAQAVLADADRVSAETAESGAVDAKVTAIAQAVVATAKAVLTAADAISTDADATAAAISAAEAAQSAIDAATFDPDNFVLKAGGSFTGGVSFTTVNASDKTTSTGEQIHTAIAHGIEAGHSVEHQIIHGWTAGFDRTYSAPKNDGTNDWNNEWGFDFVNNQWYFEKSIKIDNEIFKDGTHARLNRASIIAGNWRFVNNEWLAWTESGGTVRNMLGLDASDNLYIGSTSWDTTIRGLTITLGTDVYNSTKFANWQTAFGWGDHASGGYAAASSYLPLAGGNMTGVLNNTANIIVSSGKVEAGDGATETRIDFAGVYMNRSASYFSNTHASGSNYHRAAVTHFFGDTAGVNSMQIDTVSKKVSMFGELDVVGIITGNAVVSGLTNSINLISAGPSIWFHENDQAADEGGYKMYVTGADFKFYSTTDAGSASVEIIKIVRGTGSAITNMTVGVDLALTTGYVKPVTKYLNVQTSLTGATGIKVFNAAGSVQGYIYGDGGGTFGLLNSAGGWAVKIPNGSTNVQIMGDITAANIPVYNSYAANGIVKRSSSGYIYTTFFNMSASTTASVPTDICVQTSNDNFLRWQSIADFKVNMEIDDGITAYAQYIAGKIKCYDNRPNDGEAPNAIADKMVEFSFDAVIPVNASYAGVMTVSGWGSTYRKWQLFSNSSTSSSTDDQLYFRSGVNAAWGGTRPVITHRTSGYNSGNIYVQTGAPSSPAKGDIWFDI